MLWMVAWSLGSPYEVLQQLLRRRQHWLKGKCCCYREINAVCKLSDPTMLLCLLWLFFPITVAENSQSLLSVLVQQKMAITSQLLCCVRMLPVPPKQWLYCGKTWAVPANSFTSAKHAKLQGKGFTVAILRPATAKSLNGASWKYRLHYQ